ncbi:DUF5681 domain-containing protein [Hyphomicrobium sp. LHD-15]|uniref:DUF5681 domain-containing protein n=1 Tax=Hyphomicrobium sp. LHD-15 TaxID=3072142 RepID=UPI00280E1B97|nr:DUF5681 domain-containing protein [Hyphomicrobium sp. LHD-15]MDQ8699206.1 DUF5681 domain-containing protein [Hyphomicrobium sp. LHD-15]
MKSYDVGYGKPPKHSRFKRGQSGNPKGRPKGARNLDVAVQEELKQLVTVRENGRARRLSKRDVIAKSLVNKAVQGDLKALQLILSKADRQGIDPPPLSELETIDKSILEHFQRRLKRGPNDAG